MNKILQKERFSDKVYCFVVEAPMIAKSRKPGHFIILRVDEKGERIPLTIAAADEKAGTITLVVQNVGVTSAKLCNMEAGETLTDLVGPLGKATHISKVGTVLACGGGV
ncbi:MAG: sulfide/dihydroorotate dehydrogenase-like FAD/NAD-binding protein, partial [Prolixibacteraceae bacterium]|nr:sulfide/dihydroorotate dehydrogenase-like FAD/NAD-binding protein [Prolixibacteraceae bacterium]